MNTFYEANISLLKKYIQFNFIYKLLFILQYTKVLQLVQVLDTTVTVLPPNSRPSHISCYNETHCSIF